MSEESLFKSVLDYHPLRKKW